MPTGRVIYVNNQRGMFVVEVNNGSYSVLELHDSVNVLVGMEIQGPIQDPGFCNVYDLDADSTFEVIVQNTGCTRENALQRAKL